MRIAIIDYGSGNLRSVARAFERAARDNAMKKEIVVTDKPDSVARCDRVVLPGVGAFADCRAGLEAVDGMIEVLHNMVIEQTKPFLGICVGAQLMATRGLEGSVCAGLGWIDGETKKIEPKDKKLKIPQIGWNTLCLVNNHPLLNGVETGCNGQHVYFVHSYHIDAKNRSDIIAECDYGGKIAAIVGRDNIIGTQFHPEKSQKTGLTLIANFLKWEP